MYAPLFRSHVSLGEYPSFAQKSVVSFTRDPKGTGRLPRMPRVIYCWRSGRLSGCWIQLLVLSCKMENARDDLRFVKAYLVSSTEAHRSPKQVQKQHFGHRVHGWHARAHTHGHTHVLTHTRQFVSGGPCSRGQGCHCSADGRARVASGIPSGVLSEKMACSDLRDYEETMRFHFLPCWDLYRPC